MSEVKKPGWGPVYVCIILSLGLLYFGGSIQRGLGVYELRSTDDVDKLTRALEESTRRGKYFAARRLASMGKKAAPAFDALVKVMKSRRWRTRYYAIKAIGNQSHLPAGQLLPQLKRGMSDRKSTSVRAAAAKAVGNLGAKGLPLLIDLQVLARDRRKKVRRAAIKAMTKMGEKAIPGLVRAVEVARYRSEAAIAVAALQRWGAKAKMALPALKKQLRRYNRLKSYRKLLLKTIKAIDPDNTYVSRGRAPKRRVKGDKKSIRAILDLMERLKRRRQKRKRQGH